MEHTLLLSGGGGKVDGREEDGQPESEEGETGSRESSCGRMSDSCSLDKRNDAASSNICKHSRSGEDVGLRKITERLRSLSLKEAREKLRLDLLTPSQLHILMENCDIPAEQVVQDAEMALKIMAWRRERGDFEYGHDDEEDELGYVSLELIDEVPQILDDMEGVTEAILELGFLKTDLQVECLLRGIGYAGHDTKVQLVAKLMEHKQFLSRNCVTSFQVLAEQAA